MNSPQKAVKTGQNWTSELTPAQQKLIAAMLTHPTITAAAQSIGISEKTAQRYLSVPQVCAALQMARDEIRQAAIDLLKSQMLKSVETIVTLRDDELVQPQHRLKAAQIVLVLATKDDTTTLPGEQEHSEYYDIRSFLSQCTGEELAIVNSIIASVQARKQEQEQAPGVPSLRMVK